MAQVSFEEVLLPIIKDGVVADNLRHYGPRKAKELLTNLTGGLTKVHNNIGTIAAFIAHSKQPDGSYKLYTIPAILYDLLELLGERGLDHTTLRTLDMFGINDFKRREISFDSPVVEGTVRYFDGNEWWELSCNVPLPPAVPDRTLFMNDTQVRFAINSNPENDFNNHLLAIICRNYFDIRMSTDTNEDDDGWIKDAYRYGYKDLMTFTMLHPDMYDTVIDVRWNAGYVVSMIEYYMDVNSISKDLLLPDRNYPLRIEFISVGMCEAFLNLGIEGLYVYKYEEGMDTSRCYVAGEYCFEFLNFAIHN